MDLIFTISLGASRTTNLKQLENGTLLLFLRRLLQVGH